ncbi:putative Ankyrin 3 [Seiridium cardinale]
MLALLLQSHNIVTFQLVRELSPSPQHHLHPDLFFSELKNEIESKLKAEDLEAAVNDLDNGTVYGLLENSFNAVTVCSYSWLEDLRKLGYSPKEIADELLEKARLGRWVYFPFKVLDKGTCAVDLHINGCVHSIQPEDKAASTAIKVRDSAQLVPDKVSDDTAVRESIQHLCGLGGVHPAADGAEALLFGSVSFVDSVPIAVVCLETSHETTQFARFKRT